MMRFPVDLIHSVVMRERDPRIHHLGRIYAKTMDPRVKPAGDGGGLWCAATRGSQPLSSAGTLPPFSASFCMTCLCSHTFIDAESLMSPA
jgi:hypothetical protein